MRYPHVNEPYRWNRWRALQFLFELPSVLI